MLLCKKGERPERHLSVGDRSNKISGHRLAADGIVRMGGRGAPVIRGPLWFKMKSASKQEEDIAFFLSKFGGGGGGGGEGGGGGKG